MDKAKILASWHTMNAFVATATEAECKELLKAERAGEARLSVMARIHSRLIHERNIRERAELRAHAAKKAKP